MSLTLTEKKQIRRFGLVAFIFFGCLCGLGLWSDKTLPTYLFGALSFLGLCFMLFPAPLRPVHNAWVKISSFLGKIITTVILTIAYYLVITPSALIKRAVGGRPLPLKPDREASSYWVTRTEPAQPKGRFLKRY